MRMGLKLTICLISAVLSAGAYATEVTLSNDSGRILCAAVGENRVIDTGTSALIEGWNCASSGSNIVLDAFEGTRFLAVIELSGLDYIETRSPRYPVVEMYVPKGFVNQFGLEVIILNSGHYSYSYFVNTDNWSNYRIISDRDDLNIVLSARGFRPVKAWKFDSATLGTSALIRLTE